MTKQVNFVQTIYGTVEVEFNHDDDVHALVAEKINNGDYFVDNIDLEINTQDLYNE